MATEYIIYCDESSEHGHHFSDFYGGALVLSEHLDEVRSVIAAKKKELNFNGEVKWGKVPGNPHCLQKYIDLIDCFFDLVSASKVKIRIMFRQKYHSAKAAYQRTYRTTLLHFILLVSQARVRP